MLEKLSKMSATELAAWYGAIIASTVLIWDIIKWFKRGPRLVVSALAGMITISEVGVYGKEEPLFAQSEEKHISITVVNRGDKKTTLTQLVAVHFKQPWDQIMRKKPKKQFVVAKPLYAGSFPYVLEPGEQWSGGINQSEVEPYLVEGCLYAGVYHSESSRPALVRMRIND